MGNVCIFFAYIKSQITWNYIINIKDERTKDAEK